MRRWDFIVRLVGAAGAWPLAVLAQTRARTLGLLWNDSIKPSPYAETLLQALGEKGYVLDRDVRVLDRVSLEGYRQMDDGAADLVRNRVDVIVTIGATAALAAAKATKTIPIVGRVGADPVAARLAVSLAHPEGNFTGVAFLISDLETKRAQLLTELIPKLSRVGLLVAAESTGAAEFVREAKKAVERLGLQYHTAEVRLPADLDAAFADLSKSSVQAVFVVASSMLRTHGARVAALAAQHRLPAIYASARPVDAGGLLSYAPDELQSIRQLATYVDRILKGEKPRDMPIEQPTNFELVVNLKTAKALNLKIPQSIMLRATRVIE